MSPFDEAYYRRFYEAKNTRVSGPAEIAHLCSGVVGMIRWLGGEISSVLDVGAGAGLWRDWFRENMRGVRYTSIEVSDYACARYGHDKRDIATWRSREKFDLVVCQGVLPYLDDAAARAAMDNIGAMARGFLYLEAITARDLDSVCDRDLTDVTVHARPARFYRERLSKHFETLGCGLFYKRGGPLLFYELEAPGEPR